MQWAKQIGQYMVLPVILLMLLTACSYQGEGPLLVDNDSELITPLPPDFLVPNQTPPVVDPVPPSENVTPEPIEPVVPPSEPITPPPIDDTIQTRTINEGELIAFRQDAAIDPDGDPITYTFSAPFDNQGRWQTQIGDAGTYLVNITASDGELRTVQTVRIIVLPVNAPPVIENFRDITVSEGETVRFTPTITDRENDPLTITYSGWMDQATRTTTFGDAGEHQVTLTVSDGTHVVEQTVTVTVLRTNRPPVFEPMQPITATEGELVTLMPSVSDPDGDPVTVSFSEPFDDAGRWQTQQGDRGTYEVTMVASDGQTTTQQVVEVTILRINRPPILTIEPVIEVNETQTVILSPQVIDPDGDEVRVTYSGWMTSSIRETDFGDAGEHTVTITASDGISSVSETVTIRVLPVNRPPVFQDNVFAD